MPEKEKKAKAGKKEKKNDNVQVTDHAGELPEDEVVVKDDKVVDKKKKGDAADKKEKKGDKAKKGGGGDAAEESTKDDKKDDKKEKDSSSQEKNDKAAAKKSPKKEEAQDDDDDDDDDDGDDQKEKSGKDTSADAVSDKTDKTDNRSKSGASTSRPDKDNTASSSSSSKQAAKSSPSSPKSASKDDSEKEDARAARRAARHVERKRRQTEAVKSSAVMGAIGSGAQHLDARVTASRETQVREREGKLMSRITTMERSSFRHGEQTIRREAELSRQENLLKLWNNVDEKELASKIERQVSKAFSHMDDHVTGMCSMVGNITQRLAPVHYVSTIPDDSGVENGIGLEGFHVATDTRGRSTTWDDRRRHATVRSGPARFSRFSWEVDDGPVTFDKMKCTASAGLTSISDVQVQRNQRHKMLARLSKTAAHKLTKNRGPKNQNHKATYEQNQSWAKSLGGRD